MRTSVHARFLIALFLFALPGLAPATTSVPQDTVTVEMPNAPGRAPKTLVQAEGAADGKYEVDLLLLYTMPVIESLGGFDKALVDAQDRVATANRYFDNSLIPARYRLAGSDIFPGNGEPNVPRELPDNSSVVALRDRYGADLVSVLRSPSDTACGQAMTFNGGVLAESADNPQNVDPERDAYSVVFCLQGTTFAHELGHNMGAGHDYMYSGQTNPATGQPIPVYGTVVGSGYWRTYAHGWRCGRGQLPESKHCSIMHYCTSPDALYENLSGDFFSNPQLVRDGEACGSDGPLESQQADNARSITEAAPFVAAYRKPVVADAAKSGSSLLIGALGGATLLALMLIAGLRRHTGRFS
mgnify:CR=1 FL=1